MLGRKGPVVEVKTNAINVAGVKPLCRRIRPPLHPITGGEAETVTIGCQVMSGGNTSLDYASTDAILCMKDMVLVHLMLHPQILVPFTS